MTDLISEKTTYKCPSENCENEYLGVHSLCKHWNRTHKRKSIELFWLIHKIESSPLCKCGCKEETSFLGIERGYCEYIRFHASRVKNNYSLKHVQEKSQATRKKRIELGLHKPFVLKSTGKHWSKGHTKKSHPGIAKQMATRQTPEYIALSSARFRKNRLDGTVRTLYGPEHPNWKGGVSPLSSIIGGSHQLTKHWKQPIRKAAGWACQKCGLQFSENDHTDLHVHHDKERMATIIQLIAEKYSWTNFIATNPIIDSKEMTPEQYELSRKIVAEIVEYHVINKVSGIALCDDCHNLEHPNLNFKRDKNETNEIR